MKSKLLLLILTLNISLIANAQVPQIKWWYDVFDSSFGQSAAGDIDKDGKLEVVFGCYRNDSSVYALNAEDGSLLWRHNTRVQNAEGCNDVAIALYDIDNDDTLEVIVPSSCNPKTFCFRGKTGDIQWQTNTAGSDSPPTIADVDNDGKAEILHGGFDGHVMCLNSEDGTVAWNKTIDTNAWVQTAPTLFELNSNGEYYFVVGTWAFAPDTDRINVYKASNQTLLWSKLLPDHVYHGTAIGDIDHDNKPELVFGDYSGKLYALNAEDGSTLWEYQAAFYIGAPATIADLNNDGNCEVIFCDAYGVGALRNNGTLLWYYTIPDVATAFRGVAVADINGDGFLDVVFGSSKGMLTVLNGNNGTLIWQLDLAQHIGKTFNIDHAPLIADFDNNGTIDIFIVGGNTDYPNFQTNYGRAYMISAGIGTGSNWLMFQQDLKRRSSLCGAPLATSNLTQQKKYFTLYPNPCSNNFQIQTNHTGTAYLRNMQGALLQTIPLTSTNTNVPIQGLATGMYCVYIKSPQGTLVQKLMIE